MTPAEKIAALKAAVEPFHASGMIVLKLREYERLLAVAEAAMKARALNALLHSTPINERSDPEFVSTTLRAERDALRELGAALAALAKEE